MSGMSFDAGQSYHLVFKRQYGPAVTDSCSGWYCLRYEAFNAPSLTPDGFEREVGRLLYRADRKAETDWLAGTPA